MKWILVVLAIVAVVFLQLKPGKVGVKRGDDGLYYKAGETNVYTGPGTVFHPNGTKAQEGQISDCLLYTSPSPRDRQKSRMPSSA